MLRLIHESNAQPHSFICDPSAEFQPGQIAELVVIGNQVMATVSNGTAPLGIIDDIKTRSFTNISWNEEVIIPAQGVMNGAGQLVLANDVMYTLDNPHIVRSSFSSTVKIHLNEKNGVITFLAGTPLNFDAIGAGQPSGIRTICNYTYFIPNIPGDDSTLGSGRVTVWYNRMFIQTDMYETNVSYPVRAMLYCNEFGMFTTRRPSENHPAIAMVTEPPSTMLPFLGLMWL